MSIIFRATVIAEIVIWGLSVCVVICLTFMDVKLAADVKKLSYDISLNLMAASFLSLCIELIGAKFNLVRSRRNEAEGILRHADILHSSIKKYVDSHLELSFRKMEDLQAWMVTNKAKSEICDGVFLMRENFSPSELERMYSQSIFVNSGIAGKPVFKYLDREAELRDAFEKIYLSTEFVHYTQVRDTILKTIQTIDSYENKLAIKESEQVRWGKTSEADSIVEWIKDGSFERYVNDIVLGKTQMTANAMNPYLLLYFKMRSVRSLLVQYEEALDSVRSEVGRPTHIKRG